MSRFNFVSGGAAATDAIRQFMLDREVRRRQEMLDSIAIDRENRLAEQTSANIEATRENTRSLRDSRESAAALRAEQEKAAQIARAEKTHQIGDVLQPGDDTPRELRQAQKTLPGRSMAAATGLPGVVAGEPQQMAPSAQAHTNGQPPAPMTAARELPQEPTGRETYTGTAGQREKQGTKEAVRRIVESNPELAQHAGISTALQMAEATGDYSGIYSALAQMTKANEPKDLNFGDFVRSTYGDKPSPEQMLTARKQWSQADDRPSERGTLSATSEGAMINRLQQQWDRAQSGSREMQRQYQLMQTGLKRYQEGDTIGGSQAVLVTFQKILDPTSVVRESEYDRSPQGLGLLARMRGYIEKHKDGGAGVPAAELAEMVETARQFMEGVATNANGKRARLQRTADRYRIPHDLVFDDMLDDGPGDAPSPPSSPNRAPAPAAASPRVRRYNPKTGKIE